MGENNDQTWICLIINVLHLTQGAGGTLNLRARYGIIVYRFVNTLMLIFTCACLSDIHLGIRRGLIRKQLQSGC